jgi:acyl carrier protein
MELVAAVQDELGVALDRLEIGDLATVATLVAAVAAAERAP